MSPQEDPQCHDAHPQQNTQERGVEEARHTLDSVTIVTARPGGRGARVTYTHTPTHTHTPHTHHTDTHTDPCLQMSIISLCPSPLKSAILGAITGGKGRSIWVAVSPS